MMDNEHTKRQHFIPQFYLKNFSHNKKDIAVWDLAANKYYCSDTKSVFFENDLYETKWKNANPRLGVYVLDNQIEKWLANLEWSVAPIINRILVDASNKRIISLNQEDRNVFLEFVVALYLRNPIIMSRILDYYSGVENDPEMESLMYVINYLFEEGGFGSTESLVKHSEMMGIFNKNISGSPINSEIKRISDMHLVFWHTKNYKFATCTFPFHIGHVINSNYTRIILPLSSQVACVFFNKEFPVLIEEAVIEITPEMVVCCNKQYQRSNQQRYRKCIVSESLEDLYKII